MRERRRRFLYQNRCHRRRVDESDQDDEGRGRGSESEGCLFSLSLDPLLDSEKEKDDDENVEEIFRMNAMRHTTQ
jgi:hypothetical protein